jgi:hypothetical protein
MPNLSPRPETVNPAVATMTMVPKARPDTTAVAYDAISTKVTATQSLEARDLDLRFVSIEYSANGYHGGEDNKKSLAGGAASDQRSHRRVRWPCLYYPSVDQLVSALKHGVVGRPACEWRVKNQCTRLRLELKKAGKQIGSQVVFLLGDPETQPGGQERVKYKLDYPIWFPDEEPVDLTVVRHQTEVEDEHKQLGTFLDAFNRAMEGEVLELLEQAEAAHEEIAESWWTAKSRGKQPPPRIPEEAKAPSPSELDGRDLTRSEGPTPASSHESGGRFGVPPPGKIRAVNQRGTAASGSAPSSGRNQECSGGGGKVSRAGRCASRESLVIRAKPANVEVIDMTASTDEDD